MLSKRCCCIPLRIGSIILAVLWISQGIYQLVTSGEQWPNIISGIIVLILSGCLLFGELKYNLKEVLDSLVMEGVLIVIYTIFVIIILVNIESVVPNLANDCEGFRNISGSQCDELKSAIVGSTAGIYIGSNLLHVYFWICNCNFYKELKA